MVRSANVGFTRCMNITPIYQVSDLAALGITYRDLREQCGNGTWQRVRRGSYMPSQPLNASQAHLARVDAVLKKIHPASVVSHVSAAVLHGLPVRHHDLDHVWITRVTGSHGMHSPQVKYSASRLSSEEWTVIDGRPVTTLARTVFDLARTLPFEWGVVVFDAALHLGLGKEDVAELMARHKGFKGSTRAGSVLLFADERAESPCESLSRVHIIGGGLPAPVLQYEVRDSQGFFLARGDFAWPEYRLIGEADGAAKYTTLLKPGERPEDAIMREKRRDERIRQAGWRVAHWGWAEANDPPTLVRQISQALRTPLSAA